MVEIHPAYREGAHRMAQAPAHEGRLQAATDLMLVEASHAGVTLMVLVDASHIVRQAAYHYQGTRAPVQQGLLEGLCRQLMHRPMQEGSEHAVLKLECQLRDAQQPPHVRGVIAPENADVAFQLPLRLIREVFAVYCQQRGYREVDNFFDEPPAASWRQQSPDERHARLQDAIMQQPAGRNVELVRLEGTQRVVVQFRDTIDSATQRARLLALEDHLQRTVEPTLEVYLQPKMDENKLRTTKGVQR